MTFRKLIAMMLVLAALMLPAALRAADAPSVSERQDQVLQYLDRTIDWYRAIDALKPAADNAREALTIAALQKNGLKVLSDSFDYAHAEAAAIAAQTPDKAADDDSSDANTPSASKIQGYQKNITDQVAALQIKKSALTRQMAASSGAKRKALAAQLQDLQGQQDLLGAQQDLVGKVKDFLSEQNGKDKSFAGSIHTLEQDFPELKHEKDSAPAAGSDADSAHKSSDSSKTADTAKNAGGDADDSAATPRDRSGLLAAVGDFLPLWRKSEQIDALIRQTNGLEKLNESLRTDLRLDLQSTITQGKALADGKAPADADAAASDDNDTPTFATLAAHVRELATTVVPLGQQHVALETAQQELSEWRLVARRGFTGLVTHLIVRLAVLAVIVLIPLTLSEIARRATLRYVKDARRRRQLRTVRRLLVSFTVTLIVFLSLFSDLGSFATYAGLLTAGMAVALQNVILSMFCYFFLLGRFGVRVGERVIITGITGEVIEVGLLRIYLMEVVNNTPTGRIAVFPNLVFFQPAAFFKHIGSLHYDWHDMTLTFTTDTDQTLLKNKIMAAVGAIYADYDEAMKRQRAALENATHLHISNPRPECAIQISEAGIVFTLRYPVEAGMEAEVDHRVNEAVMKVIKNDARLKLADGQHKDDK